jgi:hypothetical protein
MSRAAQAAMNSGRSMSAAGTFWSRSSWDIGIPTPVTSCLRGLTIRETA